MLNGTFFARCEICKEMCIPVVNLITNEPLWTVPKVKRNGCSHSQLEIYADGKWITPQFDPLTQPC